LTSRRKQAIFFWDPACAHGVIVKYNAAGDSMIWATFLGGNGGDWIYNMVLDTDGMSG
jgi:hypothetical protein